jgi:hypothetical protein
MNIEDAKSKARKTFELWYPLFLPDKTLEKKEIDFELFFSGYLAGTRYKESTHNQTRSFQNLIQGDANINLDL